MSWAGINTPGITMGTQAFTYSVVQADVVAGLGRVYDLVAVKSGSNATPYYEWRSKQVGGNRSSGPIYSPEIPGKFSTVEQAHAAIQGQHMSAYTQQNQAVIAGGAIQALNTITQALPTNGTSPLATSNAVPVPTTPASPMQAFAPAPLAVINPNAYRQPVAYAPLPFYKDKTLLAGLGVGLVLVGVAIWRLRR